MVELKDRYLGCLVGLAVGDALGAPIEFAPPGSFEPLTGMVSGGVFNLQCGQYTDDTTMALCIAESILERRGFDPLDQLERFVRWYREGYHSSTGICFDIGNTTRASLQDFERTRQPFRSFGGERGSNGAIMRLAPLALAFAGTPEEAIFYCGENAKTTHHYTECVDTCRLLGALIVGALLGNPKEVLLTPGYAPVAQLWSHTPFIESVAAISSGSYKKKNPPAIRGGGLSIETLEAALWAFHRTDTFKEGALLAVNLGDDADTTGSVYGQLAGAFYGLDAIPTKWQSNLWQLDTILGFAEKLYAFADIARHTETNEPSAP